MAPTDFDSFSIIAPAHPDLPGGGGYAISGLCDLKPPKFGVPADNFITFAKNYGKQAESWQGVDVTVIARPRAGVLLMGGMSGGRTTEGTCEIFAKLPEINPVGSRYCHVQTAFLTHVKFIGTYTVPRVDVQISGTFQSLPGPEMPRIMTRPMRWWRRRWAGALGKRCKRKSQPDRARHDVWRATESARPAVREDPAVWPNAYDRECRSLPCR